jgi:osmoprotectant transport system permease protein
LFDQQFILLTVQHLFLVMTSLFLAIIIGVPLGTIIFLKPVIGNPILQAAGVIQTIPSLALLSFLIIIFKTIGPIPAIIALTLYALLPIMENTNTGLRYVSTELKESAVALGASFWQSLIKIELPMAIPYIFSGLKIAAVTSTGTATIAAFVGAGGYGQRIAEGLAVSNNSLMLSGAIPAACFAIIIQMIISRIARKLSFY